MPSLPNLKISLQTVQSSLPTAQSFMSCAQGFQVAYNAHTYKKQTDTSKKGK
jgi:hypothetical protein